MFSACSGIVCPCQRKWRHAKYHRRTVLRKHQPVGSGHHQRRYVFAHTELVTRNEDEPVQTLTQAQQETFEKPKDCASERGDKNEMTSFVLGFKPEMRLAAEAMISIDDITEPEMT